MKANDETDAGAGIGAPALAGGDGSAPITLRITAGNFALSWVIKAEEWHEIQAFIFSKITAKITAETDRKAQELKETLWGEPNTQLSNSDRSDSMTSENSSHQSAQPSGPSDGPSCAVAAGSRLPERDNIPPLHTRRAQHYTGSARDVQRFGEETVRAILNWYADGAGSGSHLAETIGLPPSNNLRFLANVLHCARHSKKIQDQLAALAE